MQTQGTVLSESPPMDPSIDPPAPSTWRRSMGEAGVPPSEAPGGRRAEELEEAVWRLRAEKEAAERAAVALRAEVDAERGAAVSALAASYAALLRANGVDPEDVEDGGNYDEEEEDDRSVEYLEAETDGDGESHGGNAEVKGPVAEEPPSPPMAERESEYTADVQCVPCVALAALREESVVRVAGDPNLYERVEALEADSAELRAEVAAAES